MTNTTEGRTVPVTLYRVPRTLPTSQMTDRHLARVFAENRGYRVGRAGGWIYNAAGMPLAHGWQALAADLVALRIIVPGVGVDWMRAHRLHR